VQVIQKLDIARSVEHIHSQDAAVFLLFLLSIIVLTILAEEK
jgi:hypothetical protein